MPPSGTLFAMPMYDVQGADARTGQDRSISFEADDDAQAAGVARARGVMVAKLEKKADSPTISYAPAPSMQAASDWPSKTEPTHIPAELMRIAVIIAKTVAVLSLACAIVASMPSEFSRDSAPDSLKGAVNVLGAYLTAIIEALLLIAVLLIPTPRR